MTDSNVTQQKIFISHATPEDNLFSAWLSSKLALMGYDVWCDLENLKGGEDWWAEIEKIIRNEAVKFLFVLSKTSVTKQGALKELALADAIKKTKFIIPLRIDDISSSSLPAELIRINYIDFLSNWKSGLNKLVDRLSEDNIPHSESANTQLIESLKQALKSQHKLVLEKEESYWSNWFEISLPENVYVYSPNHFEAINLDNFPYAAKADKNYFITFACPKCFQKISSKNILKKSALKIFYQAIFTQFIKLKSR